jgi:hypothetical protein
LFEASCDQLAVVLVYNQGFCDTDEQSDGCRSIVSVAFQIFNTQPLPLNPLLAFHDFSRQIAKQFKICCEFVFFFNQKPPKVRS